MRLSWSGAPSWSAVSTRALTAVSAVAVWFLWAAHTGSGTVFPIHYANLAVHEAGHPLFGSLSDRLAVYGGTIAQLAFPLACLYEFRRRRQSVSLALSTLWLNQNLFEVATYMADARTRSLPLVGFSPHPLHDWNLIFQRWGVLQHDAAIGMTVRAAGWIGMLLCIAWLAHRWWRDLPESAR